MKKIIILSACLMMLFAASCSSKNTGTPKDSGRTEESAIEGTKPEHGSATEETDNAPSVISAGKVTFTAVDRDGKAYDESVFAQYELTVINFWEPWCGPCVGEIPDLEKIYEEYSDKGLLILGVYSENTMEYDVDEILASRGVTYPILKYTSDFDQFKTGYVPTTIFVDKNGNIIDTGITYEDIDGTMLVGSRSYEEWKELIDQYLGN